MAGPSIFTRRPKLFQDTRWDRNAPRVETIICRNSDQFAGEYDLLKHMPMTFMQRRKLQEKWGNYADHLDRFKCKDGRVIVITSPYPKEYDRVIENFIRYIPLYSEYAETYIMIFKDGQDFKNYLK